MIAAALPFYRSDHQCVRVRGIQTGQALVQRFQPRLGSLTSEVVDERLRLVGEGEVVAAGNDVVGRDVGQPHQRLKTLDQSHLGGERAEGGGSVC